MAATVQKGRGGRGDTDRSYFDVNIGFELRLETGRLVIGEGRSMEDCSPLSRGFSFDYPYDHFLNFLYFYYTYI